MINYKNDFIKLYEELSKLNEKWYNLEDGYGRLWYSDSEFQFRAFMKNLPASGLKAVRLVVAPDFYLVANAEDMQHGTMCDCAAYDLDLELPSDAEIEYSACGVPKCIDFEMGNFENEYLKQAALENPDDEELQQYLNYDAEADYKGTLVADCGDFELDLYYYKSKAYPSCNPDVRDSIYFEDSELYRVLKPLIKRIYVYGEE